MQEKAIENMKAKVKKLPEMPTCNESGEHKNSFAAEDLI
jgi:hypothetical protein